MDSSFLKHSRATFRDSRDSRETRAAPYCSINFYPWPCNKSDQVFFFHFSEAILDLASEPHYFFLLNDNKFWRFFKDATKLRIVFLAAYLPILGARWKCVADDDFRWFFVCLFVCLFVCFLFYAFRFRGCVHRDIQRQIPQIPSTVLCVVRDTRQDSYIRPIGRFRKRFQWRSYWGKYGGPPSQFLMDTFHF